MTTHSGDDLRALLGRCLALEFPDGMWRTIERVLYEPTPAEQRCAAKIIRALAELHDAASNDKRGQEAEPIVPKRPGWWTAEDVARERHIPRRMVTKLGHRTVVCTPEDVDRWIASRTTGPKE